MIRNIFHMCQLVPTTGAWFTFPTAVDPNKVVLLLQGEAFQVDGDYDGDNFYAWAWQIPPIFSSMNSSSVYIHFSQTAKQSVNISLQIVEYI